MVSNADTNPTASAVTALKQDVSPDETSRPARPCDQAYMWSQVEGAPQNRFTWALDTRCGESGLDWTGPEIVHKSSITHFGNLDVLTAFFQAKLPWTGTPRLAFYNIKRLGWGVRPQSTRKHPAVNIVPGPRSQKGCEHRPPCPAPIAQGGACALFDRQHL